MNTHSALPVTMTHRWLQAQADAGEVAGIKRYRSAAAWATAVDEATRRANAMFRLQAALDLMSLRHAGR